MTLHLLDILIRLKNTLDLLYIKTPSNKIRYRVLHIKKYPSTQLRLPTQTFQK